ncbi:MAG: hypothetical protein HFJ52_04600 [Clostridia bacterium]|nr:hypothetical protein [Clostridia bacterium]
MPQRQIIPMEMPTDDEQTQIAQKPAENVVAIPASATASKDLSQRPEGVLITSSEIEAVFNEWKANEENDLVVIPDLAKRIKQYLDYQKELDPLKEELAVRIYKPYLCEATDSVKAKMYVNNDFIATVEVYTSKIGMNHCITISAFKMLLLHLKNPYALWIKQTDACVKVDVRAYIVQNGGSYEFEKRWNERTEYEVKITI